MFTNYLRNTVQNLTGKRESHSLEMRIFHTVCLVTMAALVVNIFLNYFIGLYTLSIVMATGFVMVCVAYYLSRHKNKFSISIILFNLLSNALLVLNFCYNSGIDGPTILIFMLSCYINISVVPPKQYWFWLLFNLLIVSTLVLVQYYDLGNIDYTYPDRVGRYIDYVYSYIVVAVIIVIVTTYIRRSYNHEKALVEQKADELEQANATKNKLFSILAHDLRSPLSSIQNYLEILSAYRLDEEERLSINRDLLNTTQNTQQMLSNLLLWTKSQMEGVTVNLAAVNLPDSLQTTLEVQQTIAQEKGITLQNQLTETTPVVADPDMLQLIIRNLINNAIKFTDPGGQITITSEACDGNECRISIADNGRGIEPNKQQEIFSLKADSTYGTRNEKGVGLGLLLCKEFTELQNGRIWFESDPEKGTTFHLGLKLYKGDALLKNDLQAISK